MLALAAALFLAINPVAARMFYDGGGAPAALVTARLIISGVILYAVARLFGVNLAIPKDGWRILLITGAGMAAIGLGFMSSVKFIPVSLATLIFYLHPFLVLTAAAIRDGHTPRPLLILIALAAFGGLAMALGPSLDGLDWRGSALAGMAAIGAAVQIMGASAAQERGLSAYGVLTHASWIGLPPTLACIPFLGAFELAETRLGWAGLALVTVGYVGGILIQFTAIKRAGPAPVTLLLNLEPVFTIGLAALILGERLGGQELTGAAIVLIAAALVGRLNAK